MNSLSCNYTKSIAQIDEDDFQIALYSVVNLMMSNPYPRETLSLPDFQLMTNYPELRKTVGR